MPSRCRLSQTKRPVFAGRSCGHRAPLRARRPRRRAAAAGSQLGRSWAKAVSLHLKLSISTAARRPPTRPMSTTGWVNTVSIPAGRPSTKNARRGRGCVASRPTSRPPGPGSERDDDARQLGDRECPALPRTGRYPPRRRRRAARRPSRPAHSSQRTRAVGPGGHEAAHQLRRTSGQRRSRRRALRCAVRGRTRRRRRRRTRRETSTVAARPPRRARPRAAGPSRRPRPRVTRPAGKPAAPAARGGGRRRGRGGGSGAGARASASGSIRIAIVSAAAVAIERQSPGLLVSARLPSSLPSAARIAMVT